MEFVLSRCTQRLKKIQPLNSFPDNLLSNAWPLCSTVHKGSLPCGPSRRSAVGSRYLFLKLSRLLTSTKAPLSSSMYVLSCNHWIRHWLTSAFRAYISSKVTILQPSFYFGVWKVESTRWWCSRCLPLLLHWCCLPRQLWRLPNSPLRTRPSTCLTNGLPKVSPLLTRIWATEMPLRKEHKINFLQVRHLSQKYLFIT